ncbi:unnamed protein product [Urochloa humidicola]
MPSPSTYHALTPVVRRSVQTGGPSRTQLRFAPPIGAEAARNRHASSAAFSLTLSPRVRAPPPRGRAQRQSCLCSSDGRRAPAPPPAGRAPLLDGRPICLRAASSSLPRRRRIHMEMGRRKKGPAARANSRPCLDSATAAPRSRSLAAGARTGARRGSSNRSLSARSSAPFASNPAARRRSEPERRRNEGARPRSASGAGSRGGSAPPRARARPPVSPRSRCCPAPRRPPLPRRAVELRPSWGCGPLPCRLHAASRLLEGGEERRGELRPPRAQGVVLRARSDKDRGAVLRGLAVAAMAAGGLGGGGLRVCDCDGAWTHGSS